MKTRVATGVWIVAISLWIAQPARADDAATVFRVFLKDGLSLVSYGEFARVGDRVVFSMPTSASVDDPQLQLVNLSADHVDWERTTRYAEAARSARYMITQADAHYAMLTAEIGQALNDISLTTDPARRLEIVERARKTLADWPASHFNYKQAEINQMVALLDEAIADLRASAGLQRFDLNFIASTGQAGPSDLLLPGPTPREVIEQTLTAARLSDLPAERVSLMAVALASIERDADVLPSDWRTEIRRATKASIAVELETDRAYQSLTSRMLGLASLRARDADVRGLQRLLTELHERDRALGEKRPDAVNALVESVEVKLDAARRLRLAREGWSIRLPELVKYRVSVTPPLERLDRLKPALEDIRSLAGSEPGTLAIIQSAAAQMLKTASAITPPEELRAAHALLVSAAQMADAAARIRREAALTGNIERAWDASAAASGSLMLVARARTEIQEVFRFPQLSQ
jgi:hypothetical protein